MSRNSWVFFTVLPAIIVGIAFSTVADAQETPGAKLFEDFEVTFDGYFRTRYSYFGFLDSENFKKTDFGDYRLNVTTNLIFSHHVSLHIGVDGYQNFVTGNSSPSANILTQEPSNHADDPPYLYGGLSERDTFSISKLYAEVFMERAGLLRVGRQPLHWGLGVLYDGDEKLDGDYSLRQDRIFWRVRLIDSSLAEKQVPFYIGFSYAQIGEDDTHFPHDDINEYMVQILHEADFMSSGLMAILRHSDNLPRPADGTFQLDNQELWGFDFHYRILHGPFKFETEAVYFTGSFDMSDGYSDIQEMSTMGWNVVARMSWSPRRFKIGVEYGFSKGGDQHSVRWDQIFGGVNQMGGLTGTTWNYFPFNPNYHVDLIMYREMLATVTEATFSPLDDTNGSVANSEYIRLYGKYKFDDHWALKFNFIRGKLNDTTVYKTLGTMSLDRDLGYEGDLELWYKRKLKVNNRKVGTVYAGLQFGYFLPGSFFDELAVFNGDLAGGEPNTWFDDGHIWALKGNIIYKF